MSDTSEGRDKRKLQIHARSPLLCWLGPGNLHSMDSIALAPSPPASFWVWLVRGMGRNKAKGEKGREYLLHHFIPLLGLRVSSSCYSNYRRPQLLERRLSHPHTALNRFWTKPLPPLPLGLPAWNW